MSPPTIRGASRILIPLVSVLLLLISAVAALPVVVVVADLIDDACTDRKRNAADTAQITITDTILVEIIMLLL